MAIPRCTDVTRMLFRRVGRRIATAAIFFVAPLIGSCGGDPAQPDVPPVATVSAAVSTSAISSGTAVQLAVRLTDKRRSVVQNPTIVWSSGDASIATVSTTGLVRGGVAGSTTISATADGTVGTIAVTVVPGAPSKLAITTQPTGALSGVRFTTQPVVQLRDAADNVVTSAIATIAVSVGSGGGTLSGSLSAAIVQGAARFTDLALAGTIGNKTLTFSAAGFPSVESTSILLQAGPPSAVAVVSAATTARSGIAIASPIVVALRDGQGNEATAAGRRVVASVTGGNGVTTIAGNSASTDAQGRATFSAIVLTGLAGTRQLSFTADSIATTATTTIGLVGGRPRALAIERDLPEIGELGVPFFPAPIVRLIDSVGNVSADARVVVRATSTGASNSVQLDSVLTDSTGRATFVTMSIIGAVGPRALLFTSPGLTSVLSRAVTLVPADTTTPPVFITTALSAADTTQRVIVLSSPTASVVPYLSARNAQNQSVSTVGVSWVSRDPSRVTVAADGRIAGVRGGRAFVIARATKNLAVADSVLVFVPANASGPILRVTLPSYRIVTDTFSIIVQVETRDGGTVSAADFEVAWPGASAFPYSPFTVTSSTALRGGVVIGQVERQESVRVTWVSTTPVAGAVPLLRLMCRVNQRAVGNQLVLTMNQLLAGDLTNLSSLVSVFNPIVIVP